MVGVWPKDQCVKSGYPKSRVQGPVLCAGNVAGGFDACQVIIYIILFKTQFDLHKCTLIAYFRRPKVCSAII